MTRPVIGITADREEQGGARHVLAEAYAAAVAGAGGLPVMVPCRDDPAAAEALARRLQGLVISGGAFAVDPRYYGETWRVPPGTVKEERTRFEALLLRAALERDLPVLGICGGEQLLNVILGGSLYQDIRTEVPGAGEHEQKGSAETPWHAVRVVPGTLLASLTSVETLQVNSTHHQAVRRLGKGLTACAAAHDGVVEAVESRDHSWVLGVQWHPERLTDSDPAARALFRGLVRACLGEGPDSRA